jgi:osmotically-inducible protein OsmY
MKTDNQLQQDILAQLKWEPSVQAAHIGVEVNNGVVTLAGQVDTYSEKLHAERATQSVIGVKALATELKVHLNSLNKRSDADIASSVKNVLSWNSSLTDDAIKVMVEGGWVTLSGEVRWQFQRDAAKNSVRYLMGVIGVSDQISIKPSVSATTVKFDIEAALKRTAVADASKIHVEVAGNEVTLTGTVHNWAEREITTNSVWSTPGVTNVHDKMTVTW